MRALPTSLDGINIVNEDRHLAYLEFKPDYLLTVIWPQLEYVAIPSDMDPFGLKALDMDQIGHLTKILGSIETDHIFYFKKPRPRRALMFLHTYDVQIWLSIIISNILVAMVTKPQQFVLIRQRRPLPTKTPSVVSWFLKVVRASIAMSYDFRPYRKYLLAIQYGVLIGWIGVKMILRSAFGGHVFAMLAMEPRPVVVDSFDDLRATNIRIRTIDVDMVGSSGHDNPFLRKYPELGDRIEFFDFSELTDSKLLIEKTFGQEAVPKMDVCMIGFKSYQEYIKNNFDSGRFREIGHVSQKDGTEQIYGLFRLVLTDREKAVAVDTV